MHNVHAYTLGRITEGEGRRLIGVTLALLPVEVRKVVDVNAAIVREAVRGANIPCSTLMALEVSLHLLCWLIDHPAAVNPEAKVKPHG